MKRNHGYKIKEKDKLLLKSENPPVRSELKIPTKAELKAKDPFDSILTGSLPASSNIRLPQPVKADPVSDDGKFCLINLSHNFSMCFDNLETLDSDLDETTEKLDLLSHKKKDKKEEKSDPGTSSRRRAISKPEFKDEIVSCPECGFQCLHSKIVSHLKRCTKKMAQAKAKSKPEKNRKNSKTDSDETSSKFVPLDFKKEPEVKKPRDSDIVKKVFLKKFEAQQRQADSFSDSDVDVESKPEEEEEGEKEKPSLKLKFSRKESSSEATHFEVSNDNLSEEKFDDPKDTSLSAILRNLNSDRKESKPPQLPLMSPPKEKEKPTKAASDNKDDSSDDEVVPQKSFRLHSFIESLRAMQARLPQKKDDAGPKIDIPDPSKEESPVKPSPVSQVSPVDSANLKNKWLQSLENRSKVKPPEPTPVANKIQTDIAMLKDKNSLIYSKAKLKSYPENLPKLPLKEPEVKAEEVKEEKPPPVKQKPGRSEKVEYHDGRPSLRKGKMIPCPICGAEYAIADNLQKHIDKDHFGETDRVFLKRVKSKDVKEKEKTEPSRKKKKISNLTSFDDDEDDLFVDLRPPIDKTTAEEKFDSLIAGSSSKERREKSPVVEETKLTEYEIFQKLQLKETSKTEKKKVECKECGMMLPVNTIKRHLLKHEKEALKEEAGDEMEEVPVQAEKPKPKAARSKKLGCSQCGKLFPPHTIKRHEIKCKKEKEKKSAEIETEKKETEEFVDDRIPCPHCSKMFPKLVMKRHLMKHETVSESSDTERAQVEVEEKEKPEKAGKTRKKVNCSECGLAVAPNVLKRHLDKHSKLREKSKSEDNSEMFAPIEITPTKEYWEFEKEKTNKSLDFPSESEHSAEEADVPPYKKIRKDLRKNKKSVSELTNKSLAEVKEAEKSRHTSEEESESENPLEAAVRKVVSYRMTPKQALSHYNLTPKVSCEMFMIIIEPLMLEFLLRFSSIICWGRLTATGCRYWAKSAWRRRPRTK